MKKYSLTKTLLGSQWLQTGAIAHPDGAISKAYHVDPLSSGMLEEGFDGPISDNFFSKLSDLLTKLPNKFEGQILLYRRALVDSEVPGYVSRIYAFEKVQKPDSYSHFNALLSELKLDPLPIDEIGWKDLLGGLFGNGVLNAKLPDVTWEKDTVQLGDQVIRSLGTTA